MLLLLLLLLLLLQQQQQQHPQYSLYRNKGHSRPQRDIKITQQLSRCFEANRTPEASEAWYSWVFQGKAADPGVPLMLR
jgi:hypothetical protein